MATQTTGQTSVPRKVLLGGAAALVLLAAVGLWNLRQTGRPAVASEQPPAPEHEETAASRRAATANAAAPSSPEPAMPSTAPGRNAASGADQPAEGSTRNSPPLFGTMETAPGGYTRTFRHDFRIAAAREDFSRVENALIGRDGIRLASSTGGSFVSEGVIVSKPIPAGQTLNAVGAHWSAETPEGTELKIEVSTSPDGETWSEWETSHPDPHGEPAPTMPDGRPNPNFGQTIGTLVSRNNNNARFLRYRATLSTRDPKVTPVLQQVALSFMDTTRPASPTQEAGASSPGSAGEN